MIESSQNVDNKKAEEDQKIEKDKSKKKLPRKMMSEDTRCKLSFKKPKD